MNPRARKQASQVPKLASLAEIAETLRCGVAIFDPSLSDHAFVIVSTSILDRMLELLIVTKFRKVATQREYDELFKYPGPLSSFSSRIKLCSVLGILPGSMKKNLDAIKNIRNAFCHSHKVYSFADVAIASECKKLNLETESDERELRAFSVLITHKFEDGHRKQFAVCTFLMLFKLYRVLLFTMEEFKNLTETISKIMDNANRRYTVQVNESVNQFLAAIQEASANRTQ